MNRKYFALIGVIIALSIITAAFLFQSFTVNNATNATAKADSFEIQIKSDISDLNQGITFANLNVDDSNVQAEYESSVYQTCNVSLADFAKVSETTFLNDIAANSTQNYYADILRLNNTFYLLRYTALRETFHVQYSPYNSPTPSFYFTPPPPEPASITNAVFNNNAKITPQVSLNGFNITFTNNCTATISSLNYSYSEISPDILLNCNNFNLTITQAQVAGSYIPLLCVSYTNPFDFPLDIQLEANSSGTFSYPSLYGPSYLESIMQTGYVGDLPSINQVGAYQTLNAISFPGCYCSNSTVFLDITYYGWTAPAHLEQILPSILAVYPVTPTEVKGQLSNLRTGSSQTILPPNGDYITKIGNVNPSYYQVTATVENLGANTITLTSASINGNNATFNGNPTIPKGKTADFVISSPATFMNGEQYTIALTTAKGNTITYVTTYGGT
jgi:hypothetical protein